MSDDCLLPYSTEIFTCLHPSEMQAGSTDSPSSNAVRPPSARPSSFSSQIMDIVWEGVVNGQVFHKQSHECTYFHYDVATVHRTSL